MSTTLDTTSDASPVRSSDRSFVPVDADSHFPIQNLPYGVAQRPDRSVPSIVTAIGDHVLDLGVLERAGLFEEIQDGDGLPAGVLSEPTLNPLMALGRRAWRRLRGRLTELLRAHVPTLRENGVLLERALRPASAVRMTLPAAIGDYTDFYSSREHATNVGTMFRGRESALLPNWLHLPVAYHGRASSVVPSGTDLHRPRGQTKAADQNRPRFGPSAQVDFELEVGFFVGPGNDLGRPISVETAWDHIFGLVLVNDWSARDIQKWEYQPLGPFLAKSFGTSISPWIVTLDALEPFRISGPVQTPEPLDYLRTPRPGAFDLQLEVSLQTPEMAAPARVCTSNFKHLYWSMSQQIAHHTATGCNLRPGDLLASGTISGPDPDSFGSLLELTWGGARPLMLPGGHTRTFVMDGDRVTMTGFAQGRGHRVGFGEVTGRVRPSVTAKGYRSEL